MPDPGVDHVDRGGVSRCVQHHANPPTGGRELDRVGEQVVHRLAETVAVAVHRHGGARCLEGQRQPGLLGARHGRLHRFAHHALEVDLGGPDRESGLLDRHQGEQVVDEAQLPLGTSHDHREEPLPLRAQLLEVGHQLAVADHRGQRRAQLVGDRGEELVLDPVGLLLHPPALGDVAYGGRDEQALVGLQRGQGDLDGELGPVLASRVQVSGQTHRAGAWFADIAVAEGHVHAGVAVRHQDLHRLTDELGALVAEQLLELGVDQDDRTVTVDDDHPVGRGLEQSAEELGLAVLLVGLAQPDRNQRTPVGDDRAHREVDMVRDTAGVLDPGVADGDLDLVRQYGGHGDPLEVVHRLPAEVLHRVPGHRLSGDADDLAGSRVREQHDPTGIDDHQRVVGLEHMVRQRAVLPFGSVLQLLHPDPP